MTVFESGGYQAARDQIKGNPIIGQMAAGVATIPLADLAHPDGTPRFAFLQHANHTFDQAEARNARNPAYQPYPADAHRHLGLIAEAILAERAAIRASVTSALAAPGTSLESPEVTQILERLRDGESPVAIARQTGAPRGRRPGPQPASNGGRSHDRASRVSAGARPPRRGPTAASGRIRTARSGIPGWMPTERTTGSPARAAGQWRSAAGMWSG